MGSILKFLGKGLLFFITLPITIPLALLYMVWKFIHFIILGFKMLFKSFTKNKMTLETEMDKEAERRLHPEREPSQVVPTPVTVIEAQYYPQQNDGYGYNNPQQQIPFDPYQNNPNNIVNPNQNPNPYITNQPNYPMNNQYQNNGFNPQNMDNPNNYYNNNQNYPNNNNNFNNPNGQVNDPNFMNNNNNGGNNYGRNN